MGCFASLGFASFWFSLNIVEDMKNGSNAVNESAQKFESKSQIFQRFVELVRATKTKQLSDDRKEKDHTKF